MFTAQSAITTTTNRMRKKSASGVLASLKGSPYGTSTIRLFARCGLAAHPAGDADTDTAHELIITYRATIECFRSLLDPRPIGPASVTAPSSP